MSTQYCAALHDCVCSSCSSNMKWTTLARLLGALVTAVSLLPSRVNGLACDALEQQLVPSVEEIRNSSNTTATIRRVERGGTDNSSCLNTDGVPEPSPCASVEYALHTTADAQVCRAPYLCALRLLTTIISVFASIRIILSL